ncbi:hypothetical protein ZWY2020_018841 [Hordeum vulgare]|nr:hypothetical protein ZWY2020_018841 [Hordeum vulgare]
MELVRDVGPIDLTNPTSGSASISGSSVSVRIGVLSNKEKYGGIIVVDINIDPLAEAVPNSYAVWIDYDGEMSSLSVYAGLQANPKPDNNIAEVPVNITSVGPYVQFVLLSTAKQVRSSRVRWNAAIQGFPFFDIDDNGKADDGQGFLSRNSSRNVKVTILSSVLGSVAGTALMAVGLACYFNSRYRRWHKDLNQLAKSMERLPGMPTKVEFADIKKATGNFHEARKLGGGGFGARSKQQLPRRSG